MSAASTLASASSWYRPTPPPRAPHRRSTATRCSAPASPRAARGTGRTRPDASARPSRPPCSIRAGRAGSGESAASPRRRSRAAPRRAGRASRRSGRAASSRSAGHRGRPRRRCRLDDRNEARQVDRLGRVRDEHGGRRRRMAPARAGIPDGDAHRTAAWTVAASTASPNSPVVASPPRSGVGRDTSTSSTAAASASARSVSPRACSSEQRERAKHRGRVRLPRARDVGRRAVHRLEDAGACVAERRRRGEPEPAGDGCGDVGEDVAEHVLGHDDVERVGWADELHRDAVDERVPQLDVGVVGGELGDDPPPEARGVEHVRLVDRDEEATARPRELEGAARDALDLGRVYSQVSKTVPSSRVPRAPK